MATVITVSRQLGAGGTQVSSRVASALQLRLVDRQILDHVAEEAGVSAQLVEAVDESPAAVKSRPKGTGTAPSATYSQLTREAVLEYARRGNVLIVGRGAHLVLAGRPGLLRVKIVAPEETRVQNLMRRQSISRTAAERAVRDSDRNRAQFVKMVHGTDWMDPTTYDLVINTKLIPAEAAAELVVLAARALQEGGEAT